MKRRFQLVAEDGNNRIDIDVKMSSKLMNRDEVETDARRLHEGLLRALRYYPQYQRFFASEVRTKNLS